MKFFRKINLGLMLAIITIIAIVIYSVNVENGRKNSKEDIKRACEEFINLTNKYAVLPEEYQILGEDAKTVNLKDYENKVEEALKPVMVSDIATSIQKKVIHNAIENDLLDTSNIIINYERKITKITSYAFDGNQVTVTFDSKVTAKEKYFDINIDGINQGDLGNIDINNIDNLNLYNIPTNIKTEKIREQNVEKNSETITLEHKDGSWKVVSTTMDYSTNDIPRVRSFNGLI